jgi:hypothetical protein
MFEKRIKAEIVSTVERTLRATTALPLKERALADLPLKISSCFADAGLDMCRHWHGRSRLFTDEFPSRGKGLVCLSAMRAEGRCGECGGWPWSLRLLRGVQVTLG